LQSTIIIQVPVISNVLGSVQTS